MENFQENLLLSMNVDELIEIINEEKFKTKFPNIRHFHQKGAYIFMLNKGKEIINYIVFEKVIKVNLHQKGKEKKLINFNIKTNVELVNYFKQNEFALDQIILIDSIKKKLNDSINMINIYVKNYELNLEIKKGEIPEIKFEENCLDIDKDYSPYNYSKYFYEYFPFEKEEKDKLFEYKNCPEREQIFENVTILNNYKNIKKYKITGPFATGKSMTLFKISKSFFNIIYINLKMIKKYIDNYYKFLEILFEESSRVILSVEKQKEFKDEIKKINFTKSNLYILIQVLKLFLKLNSGYNIILILDQFKKKNIDYDSAFGQQIKELNQEDNLKIIYCSSINDNNMRDELLPTFIRFQNNLVDLNEETQDYYFYYSGLYEQKESDNILILLFNNKIKYINMVDENNYEESLKVVDEKILNKLKEFKQYQSKEMSINFYNLADILLFLKDILYEENSMNNLLEIVSICPFKYFIIDFKDDKFLVKPVFPYMEFFISEFIKEDDCTEYFKKEKYKKISFLTNRVKGEYFEYAAKISLKQIIQKKYKINKEIYVDKIAEMNEITTPFKYFLSNLKQKYLNKNKEEELIEEDNDKNEKNIQVNLDKEINEVEIRKKVKKNFENDLKDFNIFEKKGLFEEKDNLINELNSFGKKKDYIFKFLLKGIDDYRIEMFENKVNKRCEEIKKYINLAKTKNKKKRTIYISINKKSKNQKTVKEQYNGNENLSIDQTNPSGQMVDYAFLFGNKDDKKLLLFQMKCYSSNTNLEDIFLNKTYIKSEISALLINSLKLFNCKIKEWHYILVFYYNEKDNTINNVGLKTLFSCKNKEIEYILFNPVDDKYYMRDKNSDNIKEKKDLDLITTESNLDHFSLTNMLNIMNIDKFNNNIFDDDDSKEEYLNALSKFLEDFKKINMNFDELQKIFNEKNLKYFCHFKIENDIISPRKNFIILYKKKKSNYFIGVKNISNKIICYDLESKKNIAKYFDLIDYDYKFAYVLYFYDKIVSKKNYNESHYKEEYIFVKIQKTPKFSNE